MKKSIEITPSQLHWLLDIITNVIVAQTEEEVMQKFSFFNEMKELREQRAKYADEEKAVTLDMEEFKKVITLELDVELLKWLETKWQLVPALYKLRNSEGVAVQEGLASEVEIEMYANIKKILAYAVPVKD